MVNSYLYLTLLKQLLLVLDHVIKNKFFKKIYFIYKYYKLASSSSSNSTFDFADDD